LGSAEIVILLFIGILSAVTILVAFVAIRKKTPSKNSEA
jgi:hypothetical protein